MKLESTKKLNYLGGLNRQVLTGEGQAKVIKNARPLRTGGLQVRYGQSLYASVGVDPTAGSITDLFAYRPSATLGVRLYNLRRTTEDKFFDGTTEITGPALSGADYTAIVEGKGTIFLSNGTSDDIQYHIPGQTTRAVITNSAAGSTLPKAKFLQVYKNRLYAFTNTGLRYTNTGIYSTLPAVHFPDANFVQIREENVEARGLGVGENILVLFTPSSYAIMTGTPGNNGARNDYALEEYYGIGCSAPRTIVNQGKRIFWLDTEKRVRMLEGPVLRDLDEEDFIADYLQSSDQSVATSAVFLGRELWLSLPKGGSFTDRRILIYDLFLGKWIAEFTGIEGYAISYLPEMNMVFVGSHTGGYIWRQAYGAYKPLNDNGSLIPFEVLDGQLIFGTLWHQKLFEKILVTSNLSFTESLNFTYATDELDDFVAFELNGTIVEGAHYWGTDNWGQYAWDASGLKTNVLRPKKQYNLQATSLRLKITGNVSGGMVYYGYEAFASSVDRDGESGVI